LSEIKFGEDGDFSLTRLKERYESEIANALGNLVHRALSMTEQYAGGLVPQGSAAAEGLDPLCEIDIWRTYSDHMEAYRFQEAVGSVWGVIRSANQFIEQEKPWALFKENKQQLLNDVLYNILETLRQVAWLLLPLMPDTAERIWQRLGLDPAVEKEQPLDLAQVWGGLKPQTKINKGEPLFPKEK
ncbi:MAG: Methionine-tRNA ligase, partial [Candidatus Magasanikbacteria bacterium GW2011_GWC2_45_8]